MKRHGSSLYMLIFAVSVGSSSGCTTQYKTEKKTALATPAYTQEGNGVSAPTGRTPQGVPSPNGSSGYSLEAPKEEDPTENSNPPQSVRVGTVGYNEVKITVQANKVLKVRFQPGAQDERVKDRDGNQTGFSPQYMQLAVFFKVESYEQATPLTAVGKWSQPLDFSNSFQKTCPKADTGCRQDVEITIYKPNYDYWCWNFGMYCEHTHVYPTHPWHGQLQVQTDDTGTFPTDGQ